jgi:hypothetical protein
MTRSPIAGLAGGLIVAALAGAAWWALTDGAGTGSSAPASPAAAADALGALQGDGGPALAVAAATSPATPAASPVASPAIDLADAPPPGLSAGQWVEVLTALHDHPDAASERERLRGYFTWSHAVQAWRTAPQDPALAAMVDAGLPDRLARREVSAAEARQLKLALLATLEPDPALRMQALRDFDAALPAPAAPALRERAFAQQQAAVVAAWRAQPASLRDPQALTRELAALRRQHFAPATASASGEPVPGR